MSKSVARVERAASEAGVEIEILRMPVSARSAAQAAEACDCDVAQIAKSMIFEGVESGALKLILVNGAQDVPLDRAQALFGEELRRADAKRVRAETGFAIGGVAPIGHLNPVETWMDARLLSFGHVWAAAGAPETVFRIAPDLLRETTRARLFEIPGVAATG
ncbi:YbaK/EbsC family protein [Limimaricola pyoseonensis]|uniref:Cys-tRNA(Pro) deacylase, prolyl-tRNA editing enzyme YbaK/EbsC n=1 Tax=Limimaricola pyoseonensis TaxID=521013 RepID=A0A1G7BZ38_9RHOB|nr:YbaK/EbsC family protein [Limimaricola pyoseonensis]SDE31475.1 Cys-tRNA(Pro) deacylase, prolyl-tRNA editing enzyme YbaK/EbsC [Limimaricola pyoseonensis]